MPLYTNALDLIRANFEQIAQGTRVQPVAIGTPTERQLGAINQARQARSHPLPVILAEVLFFGQHIYNSRVSRDGYTIEDVLDQIVSPMDSAASFVPTSKMVGIQNHNKRLDRYGTYVQDMVLFECSARHPRPEPFSVIPKGTSHPKAKGRFSAALSLQNEWFAG